MKQRTKKFARVATATTLSATVAALGVAATAGPASATVIACSDQFDIVSPIGANYFVATLNVTNIGSSLSGWTITISYPTQFILVAESDGGWSRTSPYTVTGVSSNALATDGVVHTVIEGPASSNTLIQQPSVMLDGVGCTP